MHGPSLGIFSFVGLFCPPSTGFLFPYFILLCNVVMLAAYGFLMAERMSVSMGGKEERNWEE